ncbi:hypothetical protein GWK47_023330 [Chionoecetes opilio]|uniref:Transmembrane protein n=1 Tax=Chionoecetes opilio TaxID=41210 RepID=A0A8J4XPM0_CHIOP|nr:hypothetical protein GWK47_023330 [Chionoecetes opilio]
MKAAGGETLQPGHLPLGDALGASAEPEQSPPPVMFSQQKGMMLQSRCPRRPPHPSTRRSVQLKSTFINLLLVVVSSSGTSTDFFRCGPFFFPNVFFSAAASFFFFQLLPLLAFNLRSDIASSSRLKCRPAPLPSFSIRTRISLRGTACPKLWG